MSNPAMVLHGHFKNVLRFAESDWLNAWAQALEMPLAAASGELLGLIDESRRIVSAHPDIDVDSVFLHETDWRQAILLHGVNLSPAMGNSGFVLSASAMSGLYSLGTTIRFLPSTRTPASQAHIEQLGEALAALREQVINAADVEEDLRLFLLDQINQMQTRVDHYNLTGSGPIEDLVGETIGSSATNALMWDRAMKSTVGNGIMRVFVALNLIAGLINTSATAIDHGEQAVATVTTVVERVLGDPPKQIESASEPLALPPGQSEANGEGEGNS